jgi:hypothetical protein
VKNDEAKETVKYIYVALLFREIQYNSTQFGLRFDSKTRNLGLALLLGTTSTCSVLNCAAAHRWALGVIFTMRCD